MHPILKSIITIIAFIAGAWIGALIGMFFTSDRQEMDAFTGGLYGAPIGALLGLFLSWHYIIKRKRKID